MRVVFMGTPAFSVVALEAIIGAGHAVAAVYSQPPRPAGRGKKPRPGPVAARAESLGLPIRTPASLRDPAAQAEFLALRADIAVVVAYGLLLPKAVLDAPRLGCVNIHASLLPRWRGAAPIQRAIMAGDAETGVCIMQMDEGLDTGAVLARAALPISPTHTAGDLHGLLAEMGAAQIVNVLTNIDQLAAIPQPATGATYAAKIDKAEAQIDWAAPAAHVLRQINGLSPAPGAWFALAGERVKVLRAEVAAGHGKPGARLDDGLTIACATGALRLTQLQRAGRTAMNADDFLRGFPAARL